MRGRRLREEREEGQRGREAEGGKEQEEKQTERWQLTFSDTRCLRASAHTHTHMYARLMHGHMMTRICEKCTCMYVYTYVYGHIYLSVCLSICLYVSISLILYYIIYIQTLHTHVFSSYPRTYCLVACPCTCAQYRRPEATRKLNCVSCAPSPSDERQALRFWLPMWPAANHCELGPELSHTADRQPIVGTSLGLGRQ